MYEVHGWVAIVVNSAWNEDVAEEAREGEAIAALRHRIEMLKSDNPQLSLFVLNGRYNLSIHGVTNHLGPAVQQAEELFKYAGLLAPDSYGLLYVRDDEANGSSGDKFIVHVM